MRIRPYIISGLAPLLGVSILHGQNRSSGIEQTSPGTRPPAELVESFDGLGAGLFAVSPPRNPSDNSLAVGPDHIMQTVNSQLVVFTKKGRRWDEFRLDRRRGLQLHQQGTYAPDGLYRWMASPAMDRFGNIGIGYSFGGGPHFPGQRFAGRLANDPQGQLTMPETSLVDGEASQSTAMRWEDYTQTAIDPSDDCTIWYVGDYLKKDAPTYSTRIGAFRMPGCGKR